MSAEKITVVGGFYGEQCSFPPREIYRGSGGRAASILRGLGCPVDLVTALGPGLKPIATDISERRGFNLLATEKARDIWFHYPHPLAVPSISSHETASQPKLVPIYADYVLVFGMLEGRNPVHAKRAVYDPQDGNAAKSFGTNGSTAEELALVVSYSEGVALTKKTAPEDIVDLLLDEPNIVAVVLKCGPQGALVATHADRNWVGAFPTKRVYKIGSGDVFSAAFAYAWLCKRQSPILAAWLASQVVALYVESGSDALEGVDVEFLWQKANEVHRVSAATGPKPIPDTQIYLAGPFFTTGQRWLVDEARSALKEMGFNVFSPIHDVGMGSFNEVVQLDLQALERSGLILALADGMDPGTLYEIGYARARGIPVVVVAESSKDSDLTMMLGTDCSVFNDFATGIYYTCWKLMGDV